ncbi:hypothetical protein [Nonomuraea rubra]
MARSPRRTRRGAGPRPAFDLLLRRARRAEEARRARAMAGISLPPTGSAS